MTEFQSITDNDQLHGFARCEMQRNAHALAGCVSRLRHLGAVLEKGMTL